MTYAELQAAVAAYMHRDDLTADIVTFVTFAESRINGALRTLENELVAAFPMPAATTPLPVDYAELSALEARGVALERVPPATFTRFRQATRAGGVARWFTMQAGAVTVAPFAGSVAEPLEATITYWRQFPALAGDDDTNAALTRWPQLYLLATLIEAYWFIAQPTASSDALQRFVDEISIVNNSARAAQWGAAPSIQAG